RPLVPGLLQRQTTAQLGGVAGAGRVRENRCHPAGRSLNEASTISGESHLNDSGGTATNGHWVTPFLFAMILPSYVISSFDATGNASEETKDAAKKAPMASVLANVSSYIVGVILIALLMLAIQDLPSIMGSTVPVKDILATSVGSAFANVLEAVAMLAF